MGDVRHPELHSRRGGVQHHGFVDHAALDKKRDLEVLDAMGMPASMMEQAFGLQGLVINVVGGVVGIGLGRCSWLARMRYGWLTLQGSVVPSYPVRLDALDVLGTLAVVVCVGGLGSSAMVRHLIRRQTARRA